MLPKTEKIECDAMFPVNVTQLANFKHCLSTAADYNSNCPDFSQALGDGCTVSDDCSKVTCKLKFADNDITLKIQINKCEDPVTITATMTVPDLDIEWSHEYSSGDIVAVPGFTVSLPGFFSAGVYVQVDMTDNGDQLTLKVISVP